MVLLVNGFWIIILLIVVLTIRNKRRIDIRNKKILITGCDSGFGKATTLELYKKGALIYAGCYTKEGIDNLKIESKNSSNIIAFQLDVTNQKSIDDAYELIKKDCGTTGLWAVINNAGIIQGFEIEFTSMETFRRVMEVNFFGLVTVTKKFLPLIRKAKGRVINIASVCGRLSLRGVDAYTSSKYAVEGFSDSVRQSLKPWGCKVVIIEPGVMDTPLLRPQPEQFTKANSEIPEDIKNDYGEDYMPANVKKNLDFSHKIAQNPKYVVNALVTAVSAVYPKSRYLVGWDANLIFSWVSLLPAGISDFILGLPAPFQLPATCQRNFSNKKVQ